MIHYCPHNKVDREKWDACIAASNPALPYAFSWYLDVVSPGWDAIIYADYKAVMPLTFKKKWQITYILKPYFAQQLGVFSSQPITGDVLQKILNAIPERFRFIHTNLNEMNLPDKACTFAVNTNHLVRLDRDYREIAHDYSRNCRRNIKKAGDAGLYAEVMNDANAFTDFIFSNLERQIARLDREQRLMLEKIITVSQQKTGGYLTGIYLPTHKLCAAGFFMQTSDRLVFSVCASSRAGKESDAMYFLVDKELKNFARNKKWFDFSGSNIPGIAYFNQSFGAQAITYPTLHINRLPWPLRLVKK
jgi:hypothetical protein